MKHGPKTAPTTAQDGPREAPEDPRWAEDGTKMLIPTHTAYIEKYRCLEYGDNTIKLTPGITLSHPISLPRMVPYDKKISRIIVGAGRSQNHD